MYESPAFKKSTAPLQKSHHKRNFVMLVTGCVLVSAALVYAVDPTMIQSLDIISGIGLFIAGMVMTSAYQLAQTRSDVSLIKRVMNLNSDILNGHLKPRGIRLERIDDY